MNKRVLSVGIADTVQAAAQLMREANVGFLPVCDEQRRVVATLTDRDLAVDVLASGLPPSTRIGAIAKACVYSCAADDDVHKVIDTMMRARRARLVCVDAEDRLIGVVSLTDVAQEFSMRETAETMNRLGERKRASAGERP